MIIVVCVTQIRIFNYNILRMSKKGFFFREIMKIWKQRWIAILAIQNEYFPSSQWQYPPLLLLPIERASSSLMEWASASTSNKRGTDVDEDSYLYYEIKFTRKWRKYRETVIRESKLCVLCCVVFGKYFIRINLCNHKMKFLSSFSCWKKS